MAWCDVNNHISLIHEIEYLLHPMKIVVCKSFHILTDNYHDILLNHNIT
jgi:hypothetical protein